MLPHINPFNLIFIDIETVPGQPSYQALSPAMQQLWSAKHGYLHKEPETAEEGYLTRAGVFAEFAKIVCISTGYFYFDKQTQKRLFRVKSFYGDDEAALLKDFLQLIRTAFSDTDRFRFCGHNIREFDIPFICRRTLVNWLELPDLLDISGKRPWDSYDVDTLQLWKFGDFKAYTSIKLLTEILGIPTPKDDIDGKDVCRVYWKENNLPRIVEYCQKDVVTVARLLLRFKGDEKILNDEDVVIVK